MYPLMLLALAWIVVWFFKLDQPPKRTYGDHMASIRAVPNWTGIPVDNLSRDKVYREIKVIPMAAEIPPTHCPRCMEKLRDYKSDFDTTKQAFRVTGKFCEEGHWTWLTWN